MMIEAFTESPAHGIFTGELIAGVILGLVFIVQYGKLRWWANASGRLIMANMCGITLLAAGGFLFRLGWQGEALTILIPTCLVVVIVITVWNIQLARARKITVLECARDLSLAVKDLGERLLFDGYAKEADEVFTYADFLEEISRSCPPPPPLDGQVDTR